MSHAVLALVRVPLARAARSLLSSGAVAAALALVAALAPARASAQESMGNYLGRPAADAARDFGDRARFLDQEFRQRTPDRLTGCIVWQTPMPGQPVGPEIAVEFLCPEETLVPELHGLTVAAAIELCSYRCLALEIVPSCGSAGVPPAAAQMALLVQTQCTPPNTLVAPGHTVGVIVGAGSSDDSDSNVLFVFLAVVAAIALALALLFYLRWTSARDELRIFKSPRNRE
jgi:hypothetical protein